MLDPYLKNLDIVDTYCQNDFQEIYICKHKEEKAYYLLNLIRKREIIDEIDLKELPNYMPSIKRILDSDEGIIILTEYRKFRSLKEYVREEIMTLTKQVKNTTYILEVLSKLKSFSYYFIVSLFDYENLLIDSNGDIIFTGNLILNSETINASKKDALFTIANTIHVIFANQEIIDGTISKLVPPDIERIIYKCLENEYFEFTDIASDYKSTSIYKLINPEVDDIKRVAIMRKSMSKKRITYNIKTKGVLIVLLLIPIIVWGAYSLHKHNENKTALDSIRADMPKNVYQADNDETNTDNLIEDSPIEEDIFENDSANHKEELDKFFNEDRIKYLNENNIGVLDYLKFHKGNYSIKVHNDKKEKASYLISYIDLEDDEFSYLKNRTVNLSLWLTSDIDVECSIIVKLGSKDKILTQVAKKVNLKADTWTLHNAEINTKNGDYIKIYLNVEPSSTVWADTLNIDILK